MYETQKTKKTLYLPTDVLHQIEILTTPPGATQPPHGAWSSLVELLLRNHIKNLPPEKLAHINKMMERYGEDLLEALPSSPSDQPLTSSIVRAMSKERDKQAFANSLKEKLLSASQPTTTTTTQPTTTTIKEEKE